MKRTILLTIIIILSLVNNINAETLSLQAKDDGVLIKLNSTDMVVVELESNPSTGYMWLANNSNPKVAEVYSRTFTSYNPGKLGSPGIEKIYIVGKGTGRTTLSFSLSRRNNSLSLQTVSYNIESTGIFSNRTLLPLQNDTKKTTIDKDTIQKSNLPSSYDWCDEGACTEVRDQGSCGSCWAFATAGVLESAMLIKNGAASDLSEQYLVSCNKRGYDCGGGWFAHDYHVNEYIPEELRAGAVLEIDEPYTAKNGQCVSPHDKEAIAESWSYVGKSFSHPRVNEIKKAILDHGPVATTVCVSVGFVLYKEGVFDNAGCDEINHAVVLVGWNDDEGYWIMRNSWGADWGEGGYMRIAYGSSAIGRFTNYVEYEGGYYEDKSGDEDEDNGSSNGGGGSTGCFINSLFK